MADYSANIGATGLLNKALLVAELNDLAVRSYGTDIGAGISGAVASGSTSWVTITGLTMGGIAVEADDLVVQMSSVNLSISPNTAGDALYQMDHQMSGVSASSVGKSWKHRFTNTSVTNTQGSDVTAVYWSFWKSTGNGSADFTSRISPIVGPPEAQYWHLNQAYTELLILKKNMI